MKLSRAPIPALVLLLAATLAGAAPDGVRVLKGRYSSGDGDGPLEARFTPDGPQRWTVAFDFVFNGSERTYEGTAEGSIGAGRLRGRVQNEYGRRTFTFRGEFEDGVFRGTHAEVYRGREERTGTLVLEE